MPATITLFDPSAPRSDQATVSNVTMVNLTDLAGKVVGFIDNAKPNFNVLAQELGELLKSRYGVSRIIVHSKPAASIPAKPEDIAEMSRQCDVVLTGSGD